jgi:excisionase family DNA binding protein
MTPAKQQQQSKDGIYLTVREAADLLRLSEISVRRFLTQQRLRRFKAGSRTLLLRSDVLNLVKKQGS